MIKRNNTIKTGASPVEFMKELSVLCEKHRIELVELDFWVQQSRKYRLMEQNFVTGTLEVAELIRTPKIDIMESLRRRTAHNVGKTRFRTN